MSNDACNDKWFHPWPGMRVTCLPAPILMRFSVKQMKSKEFLQENTHYSCILSPFTNNNSLSNLQISM
jgi:hypothetical protein